MASRNRLLEFRQILDCPPDKFAAFVLLLQFSPMISNAPQS